MVAGLGRDESPDEHYQSLNKHYQSLNNLKGIRNRSEPALPTNSLFSIITRSQPSTPNRSAHSASTRGKNAHEPCVAGILDSFTSLCLGGLKNDRSLSRGDKMKRRVEKKITKKVVHTKKVVYPIVTYPARLNSKKLVEQRRQSLQHHFFRPVSDDECSTSSSNHTT